MNRFLLLNSLFLMVVAVISCGDKNDGAENAVVSIVKDSNNSKKIPARYSEGAPVNGVELGMGWDSIKGEVVPNVCIQFSPIRSSGQDITLTMKEVSDKSEIMDSLNVSAEVSVKTMFAEGSAQASFAKDSTLSSSSTTLMLKATVENGEIFVGPLESSGIPRSAYPLIPEDTLAQSPKVKPSPIVADSIPISLKKWAADIKMDEYKFRQSCGDYFVGSISSGAEMISTISFDSTSSQQNAEISAAIKGKYGAVSGSASAKETSKEALEKTNLAIGYIQVGGGSGLIPIDKDDIKAKLQKLALEANNNPKFHNMELRSYKELPEFSDIDIDDRASDSYEVISDYYWFLTSYFNDIDDIFANPNKYSPRTGLTFEDLKKLQDVTLDVRKIIYKVMETKNENKELSDQLFSDEFKQTFLNHVSALSNDKESVVLQLLNTDKLPNLVQNDAVSAGDSDAWFNSFIAILDQVVKYNNPNILRLLLPLPAGPTDAHILNEENLKKEVVNWYVRKQSSRMCKLDPTDNECLSNDQIDSLIKLVPKIKSLGNDKEIYISKVAFKSVVGDLCLQISAPEKDDAKLIGKNINVGGCKRVFNVDSLEDKAKNVGWFQVNDKGQITLSSVDDKANVCAVKELVNKKEILIFQGRDICNDTGTIFSKGVLKFSGDGLYINASHPGPIKDPDVIRCLQLNTLDFEEDESLYTLPSFEECDKTLVSQRWQAILWQ